MTQLMRKIIRLRVVLQLFKDASIIKMSSCGQAGGSAQAIDSGPESAQHGSWSP